MKCALCNEPVDQYDLDIGEVLVLDEDCWHVECFEEYTEVH